MKIINNGKFTYTISGDALVAGLPKAKGQTRNSPGLEEIAGMAVVDGQLQALPDLVQLATAEIADGFPYPQLFVLANLVLIMGENTIYEYSAAGLTLKYTGTADSLWNVADFNTYIICSNGTDVVVRDGLSGTYSTSAAIPACHGLCNYNGQLMIGGL